MPGLVPGIHVLLSSIAKDVDGMELGFARVPHY
jgi:hypothetical protein